MTLIPDLHIQLDDIFWKQIKENLRHRNKDNKWVDTWIDPIEYVETVGTEALPKLILGVPSSIHHYFILENLLQQIYSEISSIYKKDFEIDVIVASSKARIEQHSTNESLFSSQTDVSSQKTSMIQTSYASSLPKTRPSSVDSLNQDYIFSTFVVGRNTEFAHAACFNVAQNPGAEGYNPLLICGPVGMGKTHLLHAVGNHIRQNFPHLKISYISAEKFLNECISGIRRGEMEKFRTKYRETPDVLLVDDVQYIGKTDAVQSEFFHTINAFLERKKQVVLALDRMPKDILNLEDRNRSRLEWGLIADISMPDLETRVAILRYKAEKMNIRLNDEVVYYVSRISKRSIRELEGNLRKIKMFSELQGLSIDIELAKKVLATHESTSTISVEDIQKMVADHYKVRVADLKATTRAKQIVVPRQISMYLIKRYLDKSLVDIGRAFGGKDHTTVMNAIERVGFLQSKDVSIKNDLDELTTRIHNITGV